MSFFETCAEIVILSGDQMADIKKCENPAFSCVPAEGQSFCSTHCEGTKGTTEIICQCGHPSCRGEATNV